jgi:hypothetical protein
LRQVKGTPLGITEGATPCRRSLRRSMERP